MPSSGSSTTLLGANWTVNGCVIVGVCITLDTAMDIWTLTKCAQLTDVSFVEQ